MKDIIEYGRLIFHFKNLIMNIKKKKNSLTKEDK